MSETRKRLSFYESESEEIRNWCKNQSSLGKSLELIIVDAIRNYGKGDVISAYLNFRAMEMDSKGAPHYFPPAAIPTSSEASQVISSSSQSNPATNQSQPDLNLNRDTFTQGESMSNAQHSSGGFIEPERNSTEQPKPSDFREERNLYTEDNHSEDQNIGNNNDDHDDDDDYDPIAILLGDAGSRLD
ncbi:hypothetical protein NST38_30850 [Paenibacillus sp. FSL H8-0104]|uniref:hypothetical protein n=1 Tax=Paenibacillus sp. FSL H8-0104 TaxID=2954509 RepID=UPI0030FDEE7E